jgi:hypothetical protein
MLMFVLGFIVVVAGYFACQYLSGKLRTWTSSTRGPHVVVSTTRLDDILYFAVIGIVVSLAQFIVWVVQLAVWGMHALV